MSSSAIEFENVSKSFSHGRGIFALRRFVQNLKRAKFQISDQQRHDALVEASFSVKAGERLGVIGPNGSGKSTLLKLISQVSQPSKGTVTVHGKVGGLIELSAGFQNNLTGADNVLINLTLNGVGFNKARKMIDEIFEIAELVTFKDVNYKYYSSGMRVRLGFVSALVANPDIVLLDEVLSVGDAKFRLKSRQMMDDYLSGKTSVFVSHNMNEVQEFCDRVLVVDAGRIVFDGSPLQAIDRYYEVQRLTATADEVIIPNLLHGSPDPASIVPRSIRFTDHDGEETFVKGAPINAQIEMEFCTADAPVAFRLHVYVKSISGRGIVTTVSGRTIPVQNSQRVVGIQFDSTALTPGEYILEVSATLINQPKNASIPVKKSFFSVTAKEESEGKFHNAVDIGIRQKSVEVGVES